MTDQQVSDYKPSGFKRLFNLRSDKVGSAAMSVVGLTIVGTIVGAATLATVQDGTSAYHLGETSVQAHSSLAAEAQNSQISLLTGEDAGAEGMRSTLSLVDREGSDQHHTVGYREHQASHMAGFDAAGNPMWVDRLGSQHHRFSQLESSGNMAVGLDDGIAWSWGQNHVYQLGLGDTADRSEPTRIDTEVIFEELITPTDTAACGIEAGDRHLWCWGSNEWEQFGKHDVVGEYLAEPTQVTTFGVAESEGPGEKVALTPNTLHVIDASGRLRSQGENAAGPNGDSVPFNTVSGLNNVEHVAADIHTALVIHDGGSLSAFTLNGLGASGQAPDSGISPASAPMNLSAPVIIPAGQLAEDEGELDPVPVVHPDGGIWSEVFIAPNDSDLYASTGYALDTQDRLYAWGNNTRGQVGVEVDGDFEHTPVQALTGVSTMVASGSSAAAIVGGGEVVTWGHSTGVGRNGGTLPAEIGIDGATELSASTGDTQTYCAVSASGAECWGNDDHHQVMSNEINLVDSARFAPYVAVTHGDDFVCAKDEALLTECWGRAELGETARGVTGQAHEPAPIARRGDHPVIYRGIHTGTQGYHNSIETAGGSE